jgi:hypothetical protein
MPNNVLDIFNDDAFSVMSMAQGMREINYVPGRIGQLGIFNTDSIDTTTFGIEKEVDGELILVPSSPRGGPGQTIGNTKRNLRMLSVPHFQREDAIMADEVQNVRAFNSDRAVETLQGKIAKKAARHSQHFALTEEYHRLSVITTGNLLDADGSVMYNFATEFGEAMPSEIDFDLDNATPAPGALRKKCASVSRQIADALGGLPYSGVLVLMGKNFADDLFAHEEIRETYMGYQAASQLRSGYIEKGQKIFSSFEAFDFMWEEYRGNSLVKVADDKCHIIPLGVPEMFKTIYAPADYIETVNTPGQRLYAKQYAMKNDKGVELEFQTNALQYCSRPKALLRGKRT